MSTSEQFKKKTIIKNKILISVCGLLGNIELLIYFILCLNVCLKYDRITKNRKKITVNVIENTDHRVYEIYL